MIIHLFCLSFYLSFFLSFFRLVSRCIRFSEGRRRLNVTDSETLTRAPDFEDPAIVFCLQKQTRREALTCRRQHLFHEAGGREAGGSSEVPPLALFDFFPSNLAFFSPHSICISHPITLQVFVLVAQLFPHPEGACDRKHRRGGRVEEGWAPPPRWRWAAGGLVRRHEQTAATDGSSVAAAPTRLQPGPSQVPLQLATRLESPTFQSEAVSLVGLLLETKKGPAKVA